MSATPSGGAGSLSWPDDPTDASGSGERPKQIRIAFVLMLVGAALALLQVGQTAYFRFFVSESELRGQITQALEAQDMKPTTKNVEAMVGALSTMLVVTTLVVALWVLMAFMTKQGHNWARMSATGLAVLNVFWTMTMARGPVQLIGVVVGFAVVLMLWSPKAREWYAAGGQKKS